MRGSQARAASDLGSEAERLLLDALADAPRFGPDELERLCTENRALEPALRALHARLQQGFELLEALGTSRRGGARPWEESEVTARPIEARYRVLGELGRGGTAIVLEVWDEKLRRKLAMKVLRPPEPGQAVTGVELERQRARLFNEAQVLAQLAHPGIVPVHDVAVDGRGELYFTMLLVRGHDLRRDFTAAREGSGGWNLPRAVGVLQRVCEAVAYAHGRGVVHRDLKPANVMVGAFGETYVMDWGLACARVETPRTELQVEVVATLVSTGRASWGPQTPHSIVRTDRSDARRGDSSSPLLTQQGDVVGTPCYMAPEQAAGEIEAVDARADVYSAGAMLYELLCGRTPYAREDRDDESPLAVLARVRAGPPIPLAKLAARAPEELVAICEKAMARDPARRYATMSELAAELRAYLEGRVVRAHRTGPLVELQKWVRRNKGAAAAIAAILVGSISVAVIQTRSSSVLAAANVELVRREYGNLIALSGTALHQGDVEGLKRLLGATDPSLRGWEWRYLQNSADTSRATLTGLSPGGVSIALSPDGGRIAAGDETGRVVVWDAEGEVELARFELAGHAYGLRFAPDGRELFVSTWEPRVFVIDALGLVRIDSQRFEAAREIHRGRIEDLALSPDGSRLALVDIAGKVSVWNARTGERQAILATEGGGGIEIAPDGRHLFVGSENGTIRVFDLDTGSPPAFLCGHSASPVDFSFSPDGTLMASGGWDRRVLVWNWVTGELVRVIGPFPWQVYRLRWSPDCSSLAVGTGSFVHLFDTSCWQETERLVGHTDRVHGVAFMPDGRSFVSVGMDARVKLWELHRCDQLVELHAGEADLRDAKFDPAGGALVVFLGSGTVKLWPPTSRTPARSIALPLRIDQGFVARDGAWAAIRHPDRSVTVLDLESGLTVCRSEMPDRASGVPHLDRGRESLYLASTTGVVEAQSTRDGTIRWRRRCAKKGSGASALSPNGEELFVASADGSLEALAASDGRVLRTLALSEDRIAAMCFTSDGRQLLVRGHPDGCRLVDVGSGRCAWSVSLRSRAGDFVALPDGSRAFVAGDSAALRVVDAIRGETIASLPGQAGTILRAAVSPDGSTLATATQDGSIRFWFGP